MATVQLLLDDDANRNALASVVAERHTPITATEFRTADLYLVDDASFPQYREALAEYKAEQSPVFCPVVLIRRDRTPITVNLPEPDVSERPLLVNETVTAPVGRKLLFRRVANLLVRREQTVELRETNERLETFAHTLRHELRNPLNILDGYLEIARRAASDGEAELMKCKQAVDQMESLLQGTLVILEDDPEIDRVPIDLAAICEACWDVISAQEADLVTTTTQRIYADENRLMQLLENLFRNAVDHGRTDVTVRVGELNDGFYVEDDGPGIPEGKRDAVFEEGFSTKEANSGLGLAVVAAVSAAHGWDVRVTDGTAGGARFEFTNVEDH